MAVFFEKEGLALIATWPGTVAAGTLPYLSFA